MKRILAADLSLSCPAFAVIKIEDGKPVVQALYHVKTNAKKTLNYRLFEIYNLVVEILGDWEIDEIVMEKGFSRFPTATAQLQRVVGVFLLALYKNGFQNCGEIAPTSCKKYITGDGKASKDQLALALYTYVGDVKYANTDESDSVGVGVAYAIKQGWL
jgi:crossover junction endodeoxyribonuclease RuvC